MKDLVFSTKQVFTLTICKSISCPWFYEIYFLSSDNPKNKTVLEEHSNYYCLIHVFLQKVTFLCKGNFIILKKRIENKKMSYDFEFLYSKEGES